jgi:hypothetical protein
MRQFGGIKQAECDNGLPLEIGADGNGAGTSCASEREIGSVPPNLQKKT